MEGWWVQFYKTEKVKDYFQRLQTFLSKERLNPNHDVIPLEDKVFEAFTQTKDVKIKVVIIGLDPNPNPQKATGMAFCLPLGLKRTKADYAINTICAALEADNVTFKDPMHGFLGNWARQGVLLLNCVLTYRRNDEGTNAHFDQGWEQFTGHVVQYLSEKCDNLVFMLWGQKPRDLRQFIKNEEKHFVMVGAHPSAGRHADNIGYREAFISEHFFSKANEYLENHHISPIDWQI